MERVWDKEIRGEVRVRFRRAQWEVQIKARCRRLGIVLVRAFCSNGYTHTWTLEVASDAAEAARSHMALATVVVEAKAVRRSRKP